MKAKPRNARLKRITGAEFPDAKLWVALYGRPLSEIEHFVRLVFAYKAMGEVDEQLWGTLREKFVALFWPAVPGYRREAFQELIAAMEWANSAIRNPPGPRESKAAMLRYQVLTMSDKTFNDPEARKKLLKRRGVDVDHSDIARAKRQILKAGK